MSSFRAIPLAMSALFAAASVASAEVLPAGFVYLRDVAPEISQHIRYAGEHNFVGRPIVGYDAAECILTRQAADALSAASAELMGQGLNLRVYDCYRPARAVADFARWAVDLDALDMQAEFYPRVDKSRLFELGYIAERSGHSRGSTVDLTIERLGAVPRLPWQQGDPLADCASPDRFDDGVLEFGTGYDCFDILAHHGASGIPEAATTNRKMLSDLLVRHGFRPYAEEWWHYTLENEPFPDSYFDFPVTAP